MLDDRNATVLNDGLYTDDTLSSVSITPLEIVMKSLPLDKVVGPDGINNRMLGELAYQLSYP